MTTVWIVDDDQNLLKVLEWTVRDGGYEARSFTAPEDVISELRNDQPDVLVTDLMMPRIDGISLLRSVRAINPFLPVIMLTAHGSIDRAVEAMKAGAYDFLTKPIENEKFILTVRNAIQFAALSTEVKRLRETRRKDLGATLVGNSPSMLRVLDLVARVADETTTVLISGETGTGKEVAARAIHAGSARAAGPFVAVNCAAVPHELIESELFGHMKGSFTGADRDRKGWFQAAHGGTLFLDEIGDLPISAQSKLLRAIQERDVTPIGARDPVKIDVRIIAATNRDLSVRVQEGAFREDLFYRLNVFPITIPPLRERKEDIPLLVAHLLARRTDDPPDVAPDALAALINHEWRGNVRELDNFLERALVLSEEQTITREHLAFTEQQDSVAAAGVRIDLPADGIELELFESELIKQALAKTGGNQTKAARLLGITRSALIYRLEKHQIRA